MRIGIYGGTFDPPHKGHVNGACAAVRELNLDKLLCIPTGEPPHKELESKSCTAEMRLEMTRLAMRGIPCAEVSDMEIVRGGRSYTVDTVRAVRREYSDAEIFLIMGTDMFLTLEKWKEFDALIKLVTPAIFSREEDETAAIDEMARHFKETYGADVRIIRNTVVKMASSEIREMLCERRGSDMLCDDVYAYIIKNRCYGAKAEFEWLRSKAYAMLKEKRIPHVQGCEAEAARLAERWGADEIFAREAGILHDITKKLPLNVQLLLCEKYDIIIDNAERGNAKLLHSKTGAAVARFEFGVSEEVYSAIAWHTTGKADMSLLEKIIYMADYIEPTRDFEGLDELRRLAYIDLDAALALGLRMSIDDLMSYGVEPHVNTLDAIRFLENKGY